MKKTTGKVVSLVLALALVVTSFSATFAFASTKTETGTASIDNGTVYLSNAGSNTAAAKSITLGAGHDWLKADDSISLETYDHQSVTDAAITQVAHASGDSLLKISKDSNGVFTLALKSASATGTEVLSLLVTGTYYRDPDTYTVRGTTTLTVKVLANGAAYITTQADTDVAAGNVPDAFPNFYKNDGATPKGVHVLTVAPAADSALATYDDAGVEVVNAKASSNLKADGYQVVASSNLAITDTSVTKADTLSTGSNLRLTAYKVAYANSTATVAATASVTANFKVENTFTGAYTSIAKGNGDTVAAGTIVNSTTATSLSKSKTYAYENGQYTDVTGANVNTTDAVEMTDGKVANLTGDKTVTIDAGTVGDVVASGKVTVAGGSVSSVDAADQSVEVSGGTVGTIKEAAGVAVNGGNVGDVTATTVEATPAADDTAVTIGNITANSVSLDASVSKVTTKAITITSDSSIELTGDMLTVGAINMDYYAASLDLVGFVGTVAAPAKSTFATITSANAADDTATNATVTGAVNVSVLAINDGTVKFDGAVKAATVDGGGSLVINAGKLSVTDGISGSVILKLADPATVKAGTVVFTTPADIADVDSFTPYGFTLKKTSGSTTDTYTVDTVKFAGIVINKSASSIVLNNAETFTASAYPAGTTLPEGYSIKWSFDGADDFFTTTENGNSITVKAINYDSTFASLNKGTLTASVVDEYGYDVTDYGTYDCAITILAKPAYTSDTTADFSVAQGASYTFKITSDTAPSFGVGTAGVFTVALVSHTGNDYFYKITATGKVGAAAGVYVNGTKLLVASVKGVAFTSDTTMATTVKGAYTVKITSATTPSFGVGTAGVFKVQFVTKSGNNYFYKLTSAGAVGAKAGVYVNGAKVFVATVG